MKAQRDTASRFKTRLVTFILLVLLVIVSISCALSLNPATVVIPSSGTLVARTLYEVPNPPYSTTANFTSCTISALFVGAVNISNVFVSQNVTGSWSYNITLIPTWVSSNSCWGNYTMLLPSTVGTVVGFQWCANDSSDNWVTTPIYTLTVTANTITYSQNAVWVQDAAWSGFPSSKDNILTTNLTGLVSDCANNNITMVNIFVGYWNNATYNINYQHTAAFYANVIAAFHAANIKVFAWAEDGGGGTMDITPANRQRIYNSIIACMQMGFDGYNDDIESYTGTAQQDIDYLNNCTVVLHSMGKYMTADIAYDWQQNTNMYLHMDYIFSMFYGSTSTFESSQAAAFWQEDFGEYGGNYGSPASPMIIGIMNYYGNTYPLPWQLSVCSNFIQSYAHPNLVGFCIWLYEYMGAIRPDDWQQWNCWINNLGTSPATLYSIGLASTPVSGITMTYQGETVSTNTSELTFDIPQALVAATTYTVSSTTYTFSHWEDLTTNPTRTISNINSNMTVTATYTTG